MFSRELEINNRLVRAMLNYLDDSIKFNYTEFFIEVDKNVQIKSWLIEKDLKKLFPEESNLDLLVYKIDFD